MVAVLSVAATGASGARGDWFWSPGLCKDLLQKYGVRLSDGRTFAVSKAFCAGFGGREHCRWNSSRTKRFYDKLLVAARSPSGYVRTMVLYTIARDDYELTQIKLAFREPDPYAFREYATTLMAKIARREHAKGCGSP